MPIIRLLDGKQLEFTKPVSVREIAESIGSGLARVALAGKVDEKLVDLDFVINDDGRKVEIITDKTAEGLEVIRHSCAHLLAQAAKQLYPDLQVTIGPVVENGFYYDFYYNKKSLNEEDLAAIEKRMTELAKKDFQVSNKTLSRAEAIKFFENLGEDYKVDIIKSIPEGEELKFYTQGDFTDLCRGPHVPSTGKLKAFKLTKVAGAYWRGDSNNQMLQRVYGTAWASKTDLENYLKLLEEAEKRDHRKLGKRLELFHLQAEAPGMVFWHPKGWSIYQNVINYIRDKLKYHDYKEVNTPQIVNYSLWEKSGHADKFSEEMFSLEANDSQYAIKPMNCPCHVQIFNQGVRSYRDLPLRLAEFGVCHRNEPSGALHGIMRLRGFVQDDAHIFCTLEQIYTEVSNFIDLTQEVYRDFGFDELIINLSLRPEKRVGADEIWDLAENSLKQALEQKQIKFNILPGEGAFYGPKVEFSLKDCLGRIWQCGTIQLDFFLPERLGASYIDANSNKQTPVMLHRAILGSIERFLGILIEEYAGNLPVWLAPVQVMILAITDKQNDYANSIAADLLQQGFRVATDLRNEKIGFKIREHTMQKVPYLLVIGAREASNSTVAVRTLDGQDLGSIQLTEFSVKLAEEIKNRSRKF